jgi:hypothetical protein
LFCDAAHQYQRRARRRAAMRRLRTSLFVIAAIPGRFRYVVTRLRL